jgi:hypothetical protein
MPKPNDLFELTVEDIELIESALRHAHGALSLELPGGTEGSRNDRDGTQRRIQDLLGRMHNQKIFYRPKNKVYVGG